MERIRSFFKKIGKMLNSKGYTLMEVAAVVAVTGTLAAVAMPVVADKLAQSKITAAQQDVQAIRDAIVSFMKDTGVPPFYATYSNALPKRSESSRFYGILTTTDGVAPNAGSLSSTWTLPDLSAGAKPNASLDAQLNGNVPVYPTAGNNAWKGPYLPSSKPLLNKDPWGNKYLVSIEGLAEPDGTTVADQYAVFVLSAGPNGIIETALNQVVKKLNSAGGEAPAGFSLVGDDIIARIQ